MEKTNENIVKNNLEKNNKENKVKKNKTIFGFSIWRLIAYFIIYSVLVSLRTEAIFWGKREFGKEKQR